MGYIDDVVRQTADGGYFDFARCQRDDGTIYASPTDTCRKGKKIDADSAGNAKKPAKSSDKMQLTAKIKAMSAADLKKVAADPRLSDRQKKKIERLIKAKGRETPEAKVETPKKVKEPKGLFMQGKDVDIYEVEKKAEAWRKEAGLTATPGTLDWKHDRVHALTHEFLGGSDKVGKWLGNNGKSPTAAEETLVNMVHRVAALKARGDDPRLSDDDLKMYFNRDIKFMTGRGDIKDEDLKYYYKDDGEPDFDKFIKKFREMESSPGYDQLLDASHSAWSNAGEYVL